MRLIDTSSFTETSLKGLILTSNSKSTKAFAQFSTINRKLKNWTEKNWSAAATGGCLIKHREDSSYLLSLFINNTFTFHQQHFHFSSTALSLFINYEPSFSSFSATYSHSQEPECRFQRNVTVHFTLL